MIAVPTKQPAERPAKHIPGEEGIWVLIFGDMVVFAIFFVTFLVYKAGNPAAYEADQALLNPHLGLLNTLLLLTSSLFMAQAVRLARLGAKEAPAMITATIVLGLGFVVVKAFEWGEKIRAGLTLTHSEFFTYYYMFTGIHLMHVLIGLGLLLWLRSGCKPSEQYPVATFEGCGVFWHLVDLLWVVLFALLYLMK
ncbi:MAG: cytochrome c oxidase subunit 3 [Pseudomonadota bacterium]|nr:cytochrome c oxidase subunit 3 [Pseudomonadota bacterium]